MNIIKKMLLFIKKIFTSKNEVKKLQELEVFIEQKEKMSFIESLKIYTTENKEKKKVETLTCDGDGLGIQKKITC